MAGEYPTTASLLGLAVGDAFGSSILLPGDHPSIRDRELPSAPWSWSDDTEMACSIYEILGRHGEIDQDALAASFAVRFDAGRGYGSGAERMLLRYQAGESWRDVAPSVFGGGSWGNGGAMRVAPLGAWFCTDLNQVVAEAEKSAVVTHAHPEGVAGTIAVAVAAALTAAWPALTPLQLLETVASWVPSSDVRRRIEAAIPLSPSTPIREAAALLGTGREVSAVDTVPLALWIAAYHLDSYVDALWTAAEVAEDLDTVCAIVGGVIAARTGSAGIPPEWRAACEPLPSWLPAIGSPAPDPTAPQVFVYKGWEFHHPPEGVWSGGMTLVSGATSCTLPNWMDLDEAVRHAEAARRGRRPRPRW
ncbi:ADP-ribosylglycohydrolase family protein [Amycolatopsis sp. NPDC059657]|uniref:ADP-ribosylglycohydrolase family protein n=1 Tax=Amycolatopsis sp. NPDC059657 TaxID=3346899 RepID=UPI00366C1E3B